MCLCVFFFVCVSPATDLLLACGFSLIMGMLHTDPEQRLTAHQALLHPWFRTSHSLCLVARICVCEGLCRETHRHRQTHTDRHTQTHTHTHRQTHTNTNTPTLLLAFSAAPAARHAASGGGAGGCLGRSPVTHARGGDESDGREDVHRQGITSSRGPRANLGVDPCQAPQAPPSPSKVPLTSTCLAHVCVFVFCVYLFIRLLLTLPFVFLRLDRLPEE